MFHGEHEVEREQEYQHEGCYMDIRDLWEVGRVLEVLTAFQSFQFSPLQVWKTTASWGNGELWERVSKKMHRQTKKKKKSTIPHLDVN